LAKQARKRYEGRQTRLIKEDKEHASRQQAKAEMKLADLANHTRFDVDPATGQAMSSDNADKEMARKRAIIEAALAKAKARQKS
jgi:electron transport complex protein RnfB